MDDRKAMSRDAAVRLATYAKANLLPAQVSMDIGILIGRLSYFEGRDWFEQKREGGDG
jgi:hypothetical protein